MKKIIALIALFATTTAVSLSAQNGATTNFTACLKVGFSMDQKGPINKFSPIAGADFYITPASTQGMFAFGVGMSGGQMFHYRTFVPNEVAPDSSTIRAMNTPMMEGMLAFCLSDKNKKLAHFAGPVVIARGGFTFPWGYRAGVANSFGLVMQLNYVSAAKNIRVGTFINGGMCFGYVPGQSNGRAFSVPFHVGVNFTFCNFTGS
jgi:hypothetical protein